MIPVIPCVAKARAFTLVEIMMVVAVMGMMVMVGLPPFIREAQKAGMRKALNDVCEAARGARAEAVLKGAVATMRVSGRSISGGNFSGGIPDEVQILSIGVNFVEHVDDGNAEVCFYPTGISDEFEITLQDEHNDVRQVTLDIVTGTPIVESAK